MPLPPPPEPAPGTLLPPPHTRRAAWIVGGLTVAALVMAGIAIGVAALNTAD